MHAAIRVLLLGIFLQSGCSGGPAALLDMTALNQIKITGRLRSTTATRRWCRAKRPRH
jgi:hypothetical protein